MSLRSLASSSAFRASSARCSAAIASIFARCSAFFRIIKTDKTAKIAIATKNGFRRANSKIQSRLNENLCPQEGHDDALSARLFLQVGQAFIVPKI